MVHTVVNVLESVLLCTAKKWLPLLGFLHQGSHTFDLTSGLIDEVTYISFFMLGRQWGATRSTSCKQSSTPRASLTADRCRPYYWLLVIEFLGFAELMQGQHGDPLKCDPRQKKPSRDPTPSDPEHPWRAFPADTLWLRDQRNTVIRMHLWSSGLWLDLMADQLVKIKTKQTYYFGGIFKECDAGSGHFLYWNFFWSVQLLVVHYNYTW